jgi:hypothetical protein
MARLPSHNSLPSSFCSLLPCFALSFLQIPPHDGHPCSRLVNQFESAHSGLSPPTLAPCPAHQNIYVTRFVRVTQFIIHSKVSEKILMRPAYEIHGQIRLNHETSVLLVILSLSSVCLALSTNIVCFALPDFLEYMI